VLQQFLEIHDDVVVVKVGMKVVGAELERPNVATERVIDGHDRRIDQEVKQWEE
jgi:hypothetical protein